MLPTYQKIINTLQNRIQDKIYIHEEKLPSEAMLMKEFQTSRITVTRALKELEHKGIIYREKGKGSFVSPQNKRSGESKIISLILPHKEDFFSGGQQYIREVYKSCQENGYLCSVHYSEQSSRKEKQILLEIEAHNVAGAIIYPISNRNIDSLSRLNIEGFPLVLLDRRLRELNLPVVTSDNFQGAYEAVEYLTDMGHNRIGFIGAMDSEVVSQRYQGYCRALTKCKIPLDPKLTVTRFSLQNEEEQAILTESNANEILSGLISEGVTAIFCVNDLVAYRIYKAAENKGLSIPKNLSLVGFDNLKYFPEPIRELTTVAQDFATIGKGCVNLLIDLITNGQKDEPSNLIIPTTLLKGETVQKTV